MSDDLAARRPSRDYDDATLPEVYRMVVRVAGRQLRGENRIHEIQDSLERIEAKLDALLERGHDTADPR